MASDVRCSVETAPEGSSRTPMVHMDLEACRDSTLSDGNHGVPTHAHATSMEDDALDACVQDILDNDLEPTAPSAPHVDVAIDAHLNNAMHISPPMPPLDRQSTSSSNKLILSTDGELDVDDAIVQASTSGPPTPPLALTFHFAILVKVPRVPAPDGSVSSTIVTFDPIVLHGLEDLAKRLALAGFLVRLESRPVYKKHAPHLKLVFLLHAPDAILADMQTKMEIERWVAGGRNGEHFLAPQQHGKLTSADRIVLVDRLLHASRRHGGLGLLDLQPTCPFKAFPLHDDMFNKVYLTEWFLQWRAYFRDNTASVEKIRLHFGEKAALYFAYMDFYTKWLLPLAAWGLFIYFISAFSVTAYFRLAAITGFAVSTVWATLFLICWKRRRSELRLKWGIGAQEHVHVSNPHFQPPPPSAGVNGIKWSRRLKYVVGYLVLVVFLVGETVITIGFVDLYFFLKAGCGGNCSTGGLENWVLVLCQGILLGLVVDIIQYQIFRVIAVGLTQWENHPTEKRYESSRALKVFLWDFFGIYSWFWMCAFVYVPYGSQFSSLVNEYNLLPWTSSYEPGLLELQTMFITPLVATQGLKIVFEKFIPYFLLHAAKKASEAKGLYDVYHNTLAQSFTREDKSTAAPMTPSKSSTRISDILTSLPKLSRKLAASSTTTRSPAATSPAKPTEDAASPSPPPALASPQPVSTDGKSPTSSTLNHPTRSGRRRSSFGGSSIAFQQQRQWFLDRVLEQAGQSPHDTFADYADTLVQFGYVLQFTCVWPFIPLCAVINNVFEVRSSAFQLAYASQRVVPQRTSSMGSWNLFLRFNNIWAIFINVALVCYASGLLESFFPACMQLQVTTEYAQHLPPMVPNFHCIANTDRFAIFVILEHVLVLLYVTLTLSINAVPSSIKRILKTKDRVLKEHFAAHAASYNDDDTRRRSPSAVRDELDLAETKHAVLHDQLTTLLAERRHCVASTPRHSPPPTLPVGRRLKPLTSHQD
ncbi:hypothetical protein H310_10960 [Aphanomyces invadans]|uniref:Anoctamin transmembrane domain-containing protein n=1 Tax=Aphanomyces invadans TaxID=157072 RepID=A0A024TNC3_9STRA|nr:hypothetical protein H310_10960 [Aphanomyces invadans]ETV95489.1 hypothetical protein H310_10960 [Aphanomyces invadans]|eukprot:XP_008875682.1 hypothetical protein H310_10960 [Aphanomyces invadans]